MRPLRCLMNRLSARPRFLAKFNGQFFFEALIVPNKKALQRLKVRFESNSRVMENLLISTSFNFNEITSRSDPHFNWNHTHNPWKIKRCTLSNTWACHVFYYYFNFKLPLILRLGWFNCSHFNLQNIFILNISYFVFS